MNDDKLSEAVNRSGFPLQIGLEHLINETRGSHGWKVIFSEHSWKNTTDGCSGFIDLVLEDQYGTSVLIIESKRVLETSWIFLIEDERQLQRRHAKSWLLRYFDNRFTYFGLKELTLEPTTPQSQYCVVDGQDPKSKPMLERVGADVVSSVEGFAYEEKELHLKDREAFRMYFGVIVTTAKLKVCSFNPARISITDGKIQDANFKEVPYLRFRKQLASHYEVPEHYAVGGYREISSAKESTVFVVNAEALPRFLREFEVDDNSLRSVV
ncbi:MULTISPECIES: hypothetical protein [Methylocaldum]|jgi:hypothetical protein|uniref:hypothetical protein n=1 Tax=Methylocaldum sp. RMAD-M TaxID=2806557 RepID=UPI00111C1407|nr:hypothetical protein [Methylocaldum sp. RMAD-M]MBP1150342.1 hypothetical protein [Methylocaldum sp. RMAD-M]MVF23285.1 hypothetical protein [Methylocaldum sp. BRCS4]